MALKAYDPETLFEFIPEEEQEATKKFEAENPKGEYSPFKILHIYMDADLNTFYRGQLNELLEQTQEVRRAGRKEEATIIRSKADFSRMRDLEKKMGRSLIRKATNFELPGLPVYPKTKMVEKDGEKVVEIVEEWCTDRATLDAVIDKIPSDWIAELIDHARTMSELTPYEKKS